MTDLSAIPTAALRAELARRVWPWRPWGFDGFARHDGLDDRMAAVYRERHLWVASISGVTPGMIQGLIGKARTCERAKAFADRELRKAGYKLEGE